MGKVKSEVERELELLRWTNAELGKDLGKRNAEIRDLHCEVVRLRKAWVTAQNVLTYLDELRKLVADD